MAGVNAEYINPFLAASTEVLKNMCQITTTIGKPFVKEGTFPCYEYNILIGVTGEIKGQVLITFNEQVACEIASKMMMMPVTELDEISLSAISELGNMILGNSATVFSSKGVFVDITTPTLMKGSVEFTNNAVPTIAVPLKYEDKVIELNVSVKKAD
ncbi:chemotaxis protein CheX [Lachnospiraceae bacterium KM106-2]|nr:chemotaxis protein CheX [Lachnospiraceae bacterium KM106-2]